MASVSTDRRFGVNSGSAIKVPVKAASTANLTLSGEQTVDGVALVTGDRVLVKDQTNGVNNGIYVADTGVWTRTPDLDGTYDAVKGTLVLITDGTVNGGQTWKISTSNPITIGSSIIAWIQALIADSSLMSFLQDGTAAVIRSVMAKLRDDVSVFDFLTAAEIADVKARTLLLDVTTGCQAAMTYAKANRKGLRWPGGSYKTTLSLDGTFTNNSNARFVMYGDGKEVTIIQGVLTEVFPIIDYTGNTYGELRDMTVQSTGTVSKATAALLCSKIGTGSLGNTVLVENCILAVTSTGNANAIVALVFNNTDLSKCVGCEITGPGGVTAGITKPAGVTSKYQTVSTTADSTLFIFERCSIHGDSAPALEYTGGAAISIEDTYCVLIGGGTAGCAIKVSGPGTTGNNINAFGLRTENQSSATGVAAIRLADSVSAATIVGQLETDATGMAFACDAGKGITNAELYILRANGKVFSGDQKVSNLTIKTNCTDLGEIASTSYALNIFSGMTIANVMAQATLGVYLSHADLTYRSMGELLVPPTRPTSALSMRGTYVAGAVAGAAAYTGGSGEQLIYTHTVPAAILQAWIAGQLPGSVLTYEITGTAAATSGINGRIRVNLIQSAANVDMLDTGAAVPAGQAGGIRLTCKFYNVSASRCYGEFSIDAAVQRTPFQKYTNISGTISYASDFTINIYVTNTGNNPYSFNFEHGSI